MSQIALKSVSEYAPSPNVLSRTLVGEKCDGLLWRKIYDRIVQKLKTSPIEDFRIDFEDGYGHRSDAEEDGHAVASAKEVAAGTLQRTLPDFLGIRIKPFTEPCFKRSVRTLDIFITTLAKETNGKVPKSFLVTLPKVTHLTQIESLVNLLELLEKKNRVPCGTLKYEFMVETMQSILDETGRCPLRTFVESGKGRCFAAHFGTYDYTAGCDVTAPFQTMTHPACEFAKQMMKVALSGTGVFLSDGATNVMPVGPHRGTPERHLSESQKKENHDVVHRAWKLSYDHIRDSLAGGFYQGWDLHPAQLPIRYAAVYAFFLEALKPITERLQHFVEKAARATLLGDVFDDAATGQGLLNFFLRGLSCGALSEDEAAATGLTLEEFRSRSFEEIATRRANLIK